MKYLVLPLLLLDCLANVLVGSHRLNATLSATAARIRKSHQPYFWWTAGMIDWLALHIFGQSDHCNKQAWAEAKFGGAWQVWRSL